MNTRLDRSISGERRGALEASINSRTEPNSWGTPSAALSFALDLFSRPVFQLGQLAEDYGLHRPEVVSNAERPPLLSTHLGLSLSRGLALGNVEGAS